MRRTIARAPRRVECPTRSVAQSTPKKTPHRTESMGRKASKPVREPKPPNFMRSSLDEQHLLVGRQRPDVVGDDAFELVGHFTNLELRGQDRVAEVLGFLEHAGSS